MMEAGFQSYDGREQNGGTKYQTLEKRFLWFLFKKSRNNEEQGILEDDDSGHRDGADGTGYYTGR